MIVEQKISEEQTAAIGQVLREFATELTKYSTGHMLRLMRRAELSMPQVATLIFLRKTGAVSLGDISEHLNLSLGATSHLVDRLVSSKLVSRVEDPRDRRQKQIALTDTGIVFVEEVHQVKVEEMALRIAKLPPALRERLIETMAEASEFLRDSDAR